MWLVYFEVHNTRSGDVIIEFLTLAKAEFILNDGYQGYAKAIKFISENQKRRIQEANCNAHAYRYFKEASITWKEESVVFLELYGQIYEIERQRKLIEDTDTPNEHQKFRQQMVPLFEKLKNECEKALPHVMPKGHLEKAINYFLNHYRGLTICTELVHIPLDNNLSERELRPHVVGKKTWYGTHSKRGALTASVLFSIVQSCKLNNINPYNYLPWVVQMILKGEEVITPYEYKLLTTG